MRRIAQIIVFVVAIWLIVFLIGAIFGVSSHHAVH